MTREEVIKQIQPQPVTLGPVTAALLGKDGAVIKQLLAKIARLQHENHNLNWALGSPGYEQMATPEEEAEHVAAVAEVTANIERMRRRKERHDALVPEGKDYLDEIERLRKERDEAREELNARLAELNDIVAASGSRTNGGAVGHVAAMRRDLDALRAAQRMRPMSDAPRDGTKILAKTHAGFWHMVEFDNRKTSSQWLDRLAILWISERMIAGWWPLPELQK